MSADAWPEMKLRTFTGESLREIAFPLGGIGTGTVSLGGRGNLRDWEVFNHPGKGRFLPYTFFALWARPEGGSAVARVLERRFLPPYVDNGSGTGFGLSTGLVSGLPRLREARFEGCYPFARVAFEDGLLPLQVSLEAFNPFIPMDDRNSGLPLAVLTWVLHNPSDRAVEATVCLSLLNACGWDGRSAGLANRHHAQLGQNRNEFAREPGLAGIRMSGGKHAPDSPQFGTMAMATDARDVTWLTRWERAGWWDDAQSFWDDFRADGLLPNGPDTTSSPDGQTDVGSLGARLLLEPGEEKRARFLIAWHFPNLVNDWNAEAPVKGKRLGVWYATQWADAWSVARYAVDNLPRLEESTQAFVGAFLESTLPEPVLDAASANASIMRTTTCIRTEDGRFHGFEGCGSERGCCPMNCTHVWNYEQAAAFLFPALERSVRQTDFGHNTRPDGNMAFRTLLPLVGELWGFKPAADGQMGTVMKAYREWLQCGDRAFLEQMWPGVERALEFAWKPGSWDADRDGVMEGEQHNTYDIEFYGPNTMMGSFYLGALRAAEEMAKALGRDEKAAEYRALYQAGREKYAAALWNGEYFGQTVRADIWQQRREPVSAETHPDSIVADTEPRYQYGPGCLADQLLGQWFARVVGLGDVLPPEMVRSALSAIFRHNWKVDLSTHESVQRVYAVNGEPGLLLCTWPNGGRPQYPFPYADEVWTGIEYQVAAHCIYEGLVKEGLRVVEGVRSRHDGAKRNPWDEYECGHHYARAMSSWSLLLALSGYHYDAGKGLLGFAPLVNTEDFRCFFTAGTGWGVFSQRTGGGAYRAAVEPRWGEVSIAALRLPLPDGGAPQATLNGRAIGAVVADGVLRLAERTVVGTGQVLSVQA